MPNSYFQFKQFTIQQDKCAMKVCTDACLFGAWVAHIMSNEALTILDIGAGTGLLSLMLAQKTNAIVDAVEVDEDAALQAKENFERSAWHERLSIYNTSIQQFNAKKKYDLIISNPPFFENSLTSISKGKNLAKHINTLSFNSLAEIIAKLLAPGGKFCVLLPCNEFQKFRVIANNNQLHLVQQADVQQTPAHPFFRSMGIYTREFLNEPEKNVLIIKSDQKEYTPEFAALLKDYYLYL